MEESEEPDFTEEELEEILQGSSSGSEVRSLSQPPCRHCGSKAKLDQQMWQSFATAVCYPCRNTRRQELGEYRCITKTRSKQEYLVTDAQLDKLKSVEVRNPKLERSRHMMRLYMLADVRRAAWQVWRDQSGLDEERQRRRDKKDAAARNKKIKFSLVEEKVPSAAGGKGVKAGQGEAVRRLLSPVTPAIATTTTDFSSRVRVPHKHRFGEAKPTGNEDEFVHECGECGLRQTFESF